MDCRTPAVDGGGVEQRGGHRKMLFSGAQRGSLRLDFEAHHVSYLLLSNKFKF